MKKPLEEFENSVYSVKRKVLNYDIVISQLKEDKIG